MTGNSSAAAAETNSGGRSIAPAERLHNVAWVAAVAFLIGCAGYFGYAIYQVATREIPGLSVPNDFSVMWAAGKLALQGRAVEAFDVELLNQTRNLPPWTGDAGYRMGWLYPAQFHALVTPFGLLPFMTAWLTFSVVGLALFALAARRLIPSGPAAMIAIASPAVLMCLIQGQNTLIVGALLAGFLAALRTQNALISGILLGLLTIKPQFGLLLPLILVVTGNWRVIGWAVVTVAVLFIASLLWVGTDYWVAFFDGIRVTDEWIRTGWLPRHLMVTWYAFGLASGLGPDQAKWLQMGAALAIAALVVWTWRRNDLTFERKAAILTIAIPLVTPYAYFYDLVLPVLGAGLLLAIPGPRDPQRLFAVIAIWALPTLGHGLREAGLVHGFAFLGAPVLTLSLIALLVNVPRPLQVTHDAN